MYPAAKKTSQEETRDKDVTPPGRVRLVLLVGFISLRPFKCCSWGRSPVYFLAGLKCMLCVHKEEHINLKKTPKGHFNNTCLCTKPVNKHVKYHKQKKLNKG